LYHTSYLFVCILFLRQGLHATFVQADPQTQTPPASASWEAGIQACTSMPIFCLFILCLSLDSSKPQGSFYLYLSKDLKGSWGTHE
jgi:hypothetical protein